MNAKLTAIHKDIEGIRTFTDESYLVTAHFVIFLLFGCREEQRRILQTKAYKLIADRQAFAMINAPEDAKAVVPLIQDAIMKVSEAHINLVTLTEIHMCPVIFSENADPDSYIEVLMASSDYLKSRTIKNIWKPFLMLNTLADNANAWIATVSEGIKRLNIMQSCRCCVLTQEAETAFATDEEHRLTSLLFVAFLHAVVATREDIGRQISIHTDIPDDLFYTAQTAFIENPVITRIFKRMRGILVRFRKSAEKTQDIDMSFAYDILKASYDKMPHEGNAISLLPVYSVMPGTTAEFKKRLSQFALQHYLSFSRNEKEKHSVYSKISSKFLCNFLMTGHGLDDLNSLKGNNEQIEKLTRIRVQGITVNPLPKYPGKSKHSGEITDIFESFVQRLTNEINNSSKKLLEEYFNSDEFYALPAKLKAAQDTIDDEISEMAVIIQKRSITDLSLPLYNDPDEKWLEDTYSDPKTVEFFIQHLSEMALAENEDIYNSELDMLLDKLYETSKSLSGDSGAKSYMRQISDTCRDAESDYAKACIKTIGDALIFPIRVEGNIGSKISQTYVWGSDDNDLYRVWDKLHSKMNANSLLLPLKSQERFAILRVSSPFSSDKILGISNRTQE